MKDEIKPPLAVIKAAEQFAAALNEGAEYPPRTPMDSSSLDEEPFPTHCTCEKPTPTAVGRCFNCCLKVESE